MNPKVLISYNWNGREEKRWLFWLQKKLEAKGCTVELSELPKIPIHRESEWITRLEEITGAHTTHFVKHDPGCLTILSYLDRLVEKKSQEKVLLIAGMEKSSALPVNFLLESKPDSKRLEPPITNQVVAETTASRIVSTRTIENIPMLDTKLVIVYDGSQSSESKMLNLGTSITNLLLSKPKKKFFQH